MVDKDIPLLILVCSLFPLQFHSAFLWLSVTRSTPPPRPFSHSFSHQNHFCTMWVWSLSLLYDGSSRIQTRVCLWHGILDLLPSDPKLFPSPGSYHVVHFSYRADVLVLLGHAICFNASVCLIPLFPWKILLPVPPSLKSCMLGHLLSLHKRNCFLSCLDSQYFLPNWLEGMSEKVMVAVIRGR